MSTTTVAPTAPKPLPVTTEAPKPGLRLLDLLADIEGGNEIYFKYVKVAADLMSHPVHKLDLDAKLKDAVAAMKAHHVRHLALVDTEDGGDAFIGVISHRDIARQLSREAGTNGEAETDVKMLQAPVSSIVTRKPHAVTLSTGIFDCANLMVTKKVDCLPVLDERKALAGIITSADLLQTFVVIAQLQRMAGRSERRRARLIDLTGGRREMDSKMVIASHFKCVGDLMTERPKDLAPHQTIKDAMDRMQESRVRHVPIVDEAHKIVGLVTDVDILHALPPAKERRPGRGGEAPFREALFEVASNDPALKLPLSDIMVPEARLTVVKRTDPMIDVLGLLLKNQLSGMLVAVSESDRRCAGIITTTDFIRAVSALGQMLTQGTA